MTDPTQMVPAADGPDGPDGPMDRRVVAIIVLAVIIVVLLLLLLLVAVTGDDGDDAATTSSTTTSESTTSSTTSSSTTSSTTTTAATSSTTESTTTTTTTTTTAPPPSTVAPSRCTGNTGPTEPEPVAEVFYDAWTIDDRNCAEQVATDPAVDELFALNGAGNEWMFMGCNTVEDPEPFVDCAYFYEGGSAHFEMNFGAIDGWRIFDVRFVAD